MPTAAQTCPICSTPLPEQAHFCPGCGLATPTDPGVPPRTAVTGVVEVAQVKKALAGRYQVERILGEGGMATVYLAQDQKHNRKVAVKVMRPELAATLGADRFLREVQVAAQLSHPHILPMYDSGEADGLLYYVMPYVEGETLKERMAKEGRMRVEDALRLAREVADALGYAHARGIIHRDIKPGNILLQSGHALVADFGIARAVGGDGEALTQTGLAVGTPQYMAPEQATGERDVDGRADIYALGAVTYEMIAGEPPFTGPSARAIITRSLTEAPRALTASREGLAPAVNSAIMKALAKDRADRFSDVRDLVGALDRVIEAVRSGSTVAPIPAGPTPLQVWGFFALGCVGMLALVTALIRQWNLPRWTLGLAIGLLVIGAAVLVLTGRLEARRRAGGATPGLQRLFTWRNAALGGVLSLLLWAGVATALTLQGPGGARVRAGGNHLAIIPFDNQGATDDAYFADGISDEIRGKLAQVRGLTVIASGSANQYRASTKTPQEIARELGADYLLVGKVRWAGPAGGTRRVQVAPELVDGHTGATTWSQSFDTDVTNIFEVQSQIATRVASALGAQLGTQDVQQLAGRPTTNVAAYDSYLKGKALTATDAGTMRQAAAYFEQAVALDSAFVDAWAALAGSLARVYVNGTRDPVALARALVATERAIALDPNSAAGYAAAAMFYTTAAPDASKASAAMDRALELAPNDANVLVRAASLDRANGKSDAAATNLERARELDPRSVRVLIALQVLYLEQHRFAEALEAGQASMALEPLNADPMQNQAMVHLAMGDLNGARAVIRAGISRGMPATSVAAIFGGYFEVSWALDDAERSLLFRLTPAAFDNARGWWGQSLAIAHWQQGNPALARAYADSALGPTVEQVAASAPGDGQTRGLHALMLALLGRKAEAVALGQRAVAMEQTGQVNMSYDMLLLIRTYLAVGEQDAALDVIEKLLQRPFWVTPAWLGIDPSFNSLRGNPRFERIVKGG